LDTTLQKIDEILKETIIVNGIKVVTGTMFLSRNVDFDHCESYLRQNLKSRYIFAIGIFKDGYMNIGFSVSDDLQKFASSQDIKQFFQNKEVFNRYLTCSPSKVRAMADPLKKVLIEYVKSRDWESPENQEESDPA
jgi:hypothetical protein